ncbi:PspA/IM30 family protein [Marinithermus hydrothermalis]|uniref:Phage shock protein A, PspA n=1 Tax=Marinithermus hydrothermalis (strain DSM 14884 / JCM 11576 / T1) TaxID=869210 RepID=F2NN32_MARHT|nr:PspA/IM30 family protein [Marinithermus hydrothermalis]AEB12771.1 phage shock protein A, PspA [Marinithermus hydrothermalis DSM 14884]
MGVLDRLSRLIRANLNDLLRRAEDPEKILNQALEDMRQALKEARLEVAGAGAELKKLERERQRYAEQAAAWKAKAAEALKIGREDLAREALKRKQQAEALAEGFHEPIEAQQQVVARLKTQLRALEAKIAEAERRRKLLLARKKGVEAAEAVRRMESKVDAHPALEVFEEMEARLLEMEDRHEALASMDREVDLEAELAQLGAEREVDEELAALKRELGLNP